MRYRRPLIIVFVIGVFAGVTYFAWNAWMRSATERSVQRAVTLLQQGDVQRTREELQWPLWFNPQHPKALQLMGLSYVRQKKWPEAITYLERITTGAPMHAESQVHLAAALLADRQLERVETVLGDLLRTEPTSLMGARLLSGLLLTELRRDEAVTVLEEFLRHQADDKVTLADHLLILRDLSTAEFHPPLASECLPTLKESLQRHPQQSTIQLALGQCEWDAGHLVEAESLLRAALKSRPQDGRFRAVMCEFLIEAGRGDEATKVFAEGKEPPSTASAWIIQSQIAELHEDYAQALEHQDRAAAIRRSGKEELARRGRLLQRLNRVEEAQAAHAHAYEWGRVELDLWNLSRDLGVRMPTLQECEIVAKLYGALQKPVAAAGWRKLAKLIENESASRVP